MSVFITILFLIVPFVVVADTVVLFTMRARVKKLNQVTTKMLKKVMQADLNALAIGAVGVSETDDTVDALIQDMM